MQTARENGKLILQSVAVFLKWVLIAGVVGAVGGLVGSTFHLSVEVALTLVVGYDGLFGSVEGQSFTLGTRTDL